MTSRRRNGLRLAMWVRWVGLAALCLALIGPTAAFAQGKPAEPKPEDAKGYTLPYFFTLIGFLAVVVPVCMAVGRKWDYGKEEEAD